MKVFLLLTLLCPLSGTLLHAQEAPPRHALVMGVGDYAGATYKGKTIPSLPGITTADLPNMAAKLKSLGFAVTVVTDPTLSEAKAAVDAFSAKLKAAPGVSLFYFSGHGGEYEGKNYLIPRRASIGSKADLADEALSAQRVLNGMEESSAQVNLVFLDCCREDLGKNIGGAEMQPMRARGSFIGFATRSGDFADPGEEGSPYTRFLLKHLDKPGLSVADMYGYVVRDVKDYTKQVLGEERRPGFYSELEGEPFYFVPASLKTTTAPTMTEGEIERRARELATRMAAGSAAVPRQPPVDGGAANGAPSGSILDQGSIGKVIQIKLPGGQVMKFAYCPPGSFTMGSPASEAERGSDEDQVEVTLTQGFWMAQTECTQAQWQAVMGTSIQEQAKLGDGKNLYGARAELPMYNVNHDEATAFCEKLQSGNSLPAGWKVTLPSEAQWEYACRAGTTGAYAGNNPISYFDKVASYFEKKITLDDQAWYRCGGPHAVASKQANAWGLCDMHGNVCEWCADWYGHKLSGGTDPCGAAQSNIRVIRGGSWNSSPVGCRAACRDNNDPGLRISNLGFRPALVPAK